MNCDLNWIDGFAGGRSVWFGREMAVGPGRGDEGKVGRTVSAVGGRGCVPDDEDAGGDGRRSTTETNRETSSPMSMENAFFFVLANLRMIDRSLETKVTNYQGADKKN
jgi:hypothetical protein